MLAAHSTQDALRRTAKVPAGHVVPENAHAELAPTLKLPAAHGAHAASPAAPEKVPGSQGRHAEEESAPAAAAYLPAGHAVQEMEPILAAYHPGAQVEQEGAPCAPLVEVPRGQRVHADDALAPNVALAVPRSHSWQPGCPTRVLNDPAGQGSHATAPTNENSPTGQVAQLLPAAKNVPAGHNVEHHSAPAALKRPLGQG